MTSKLLDPSMLPEERYDDGREYGNIALHSDSNIPLGSAPQSTSGEEMEVSINLDATGDRDCTVCQHHNKKSIAMCVCVSCGQLLLCEECALIHDKKIKDHMVERLKPEKMEVCKISELPLDRYCSTCKKTMCTQCIMFEQHQHDVYCLADVINTGVTEIKELIRKKEREIEEREEEKEKLFALDRYTAMKERRDELKRQVKLQAERNIEAIGRMEKEVLRDIDKKFEVISAISEYTRMFNMSKEKAIVSIRDAEKRVTVPGQSCRYVEELNSIKKEISGISVAGVADVGICAEILQDAIANVCRFIPQNVQSIGRIEDRRQRKLPDVFHPKGEGKYAEEEIAKQGEFCTQAAVISDKYYAVSFRKSEYFFIYEFPFIKRHSITGDVWGMSETPEGNLLVILDPPDKPHNIVNTYNPESGDIVSSENVLISKPCLGVCVIPKHQFIILHGPTVKRLLSLFEGNGKLKVTYEIGDGDQLFRPLRISHGGKLIFVAGNPNVGVYMIHEGKIKRVKTLKSEYDSHGIAATTEGDFFLCGMKDSKWYLVRYRRKDDQLEWEEKAVSVRIDGKMRPNIVTSDGRTIVVTDDCEICLFKA